MQMKRLFVLLLTLSAINVFAQSEKKVSAITKNVTVFRQKAQIEANIKTTISAGITKIVIEEIAGSTDVNSIKVGGKGDFTIMGVQFIPNLLNKRSTRLHDSLQLVKNEMATIQMLIEVAENESKMILSNSSSMKSQQDGLLPEDFKEMIEFTRTKLTEVGTRKLQLRKQEDELKKQLERIQNQISAYSGYNQSVGNMIVTVSAKQSTNVDLDIAYLANNCGWYPTYDIRVAAINQPVALNYKANVYQTTGIDWKNVKLSLSTTDPNANSVKPTLNPQYLTIFEYNAAPVMMKTMRMDAPMAAAAEIVEADAVVMPVQMVESTLAVTFNLSIPYSIPTSGNPELVEIQAYNLPAEYAFEIVPKYDSNGFLVAKLKDWEKLNLLNGNANVYFDGMFVGQTIISHDVKDELTISLGNDKKIISTREEIQDFKTRKAVGGSIKESFGYKITIRNTKNEVIKVKVEDQYPVSQDSRVEVEVEEIKDAQVETTTGKVTWDVTLQPNQSKELFLKYTVKYPKDKQVSNL